MKKKSKYLIFIIVILVLVIISIMSLFYVKSTESINKDDYSQVHFKNLGNSNITVIEKDDFIVLVNTGINDDLEALSDYLIELDIDEIDYLILTNFDDKYIGNVKYLMDLYKVSYVYINDYDYTSELKEVLDTSLLDNYAESIILTINEQITFSNLKIKIYPYLEDTSNMNDKSLIMELYEEDKKICIYNNASDIRIDELESCYVVVSESDDLYDIDSTYYLYNGDGTIKDSDNLLSKNVSIYLNNNDFIIEE